MTDDERFYDRRFERTGWDPLGRFDERRAELKDSSSCRSCGSPDPAIIRGEFCSDCRCWLASHIDDCPGKSGGQHQLRPEWITVGDPDDGYVIEVEMS